MPAGRPTVYAEKIASMICDRLAGGEPLSKICEDEAMPGRTTVYAWRHAHPEFQNKYARAREDAADVWAERAVAMAMTATPETAQAVRVKYDAIRWYASKLAPKVYGDKVQHTGAEGGALLYEFRWASDPPPDPAPIAAGPVLGIELEAEAEEASTDESTEIVRWSD